MDWNIKPETVKLLLENISSKLSVISPDDDFCIWHQNAKATKPKGLHQTKRLLCCAMLSHFSRVRLIATLRTVAFQSPLSQGFSGKESMGCHALLQGIFLTQGSNPCLLQLPHCRQILHHWATREWQRKF